MLKLTTEIDDIFAIAITRYVLVAAVSVPARGQTGFQAKTQAAVSGGKPFSIVNLTATAEWTTGSDQESGTAQLQAKADGWANVQLSLRKASRTEAQTAADSSRTCTWTNAAGTTATASIAYKTYTVQTNFQCSGITEHGATSVNLVDHSTLPDASASNYSFTYEPTPGASGAVTGRLASVTLPTGGTISYSYSGGCSSAGYCPKLIFFSLPSKRYFQRHSLPPAFVTSRNRPPASAIL